MAIRQLSKTHHSRKTQILKNQNLRIKRIMKLILAHLLMKKMARPKRKMVKKALIVNLRKKLKTMKMEHTAHCPKMKKCKKGLIHQTRSSAASTSSRASVSAS